MKVEVIKAFPYAHDGVHTEMLDPGEREIRDLLVPGLAAAGLVEMPPNEKTLPNVPPLGRESGAPENEALPGPSETKTTTDTLPQRDRRKR